VAGGAVRILLSLEDSDLKLLRECIKDKIKYSTHSEGVRFKGLDAKIRDILIKSMVLKEEDE
jgi:hypothetical protein